MTQEFEEWYSENHHRFGLGGFKSCHWVWRASREQLRAKLLSDEMVQAVGLAIIIARDGVKDGERRYKDFVVRQAYHGDAKAALGAIVRNLS